MGERHITIARWTYCKYRNWMHFGSCINNDSLNEDFSNEEEDLVTIQFSENLIKSQINSMLVYEIKQKINHFDLLDKNYIF